MSPVKKTSSAAEAMTPHLADPMLINRLNQQNIWEILSSLPGEYTKQDIIDYLKYKHGQLGDLLQNFKTMSMFAEPAEEIRVMETNPQFAFTGEDEAELMGMMGRIGRMAAKAAMSPGTEAGGGRAQAKVVERPPANEMAEAESLLAEFEEFMADFEGRIFEVQLQMEMESKNEELKNEMQRILGLVRSGKIDAVFVLIALAKVNVLKNGLVFSQLGRKLWRVNDAANKVTNELLSESTTGPTYMAQLQVTAQKQKELGVQQQFLIQDMQKVTQNIETVLSFAKTSIDEIFKTRMHIINAPFKNL